MPSRAIIALTPNLSWGKSNQRAVTLVVSTDAVGQVLGELSL